MSAPKNDGATSATEKRRAVPDLANYTTGDFRRGRSRLIEAVWLVVQALCVSSPVPGSWLRRSALRLFGARIGAGVVIKPGVRVKFPWRLAIGDHSWIGESVWLDNLAEIRIGSNCCVSQGAYLCTGNHDWSSPEFSLSTAPIVLEDGAWVAARAVVGPGVTIGEAAVVGLGCAVTRDVPPGAIATAPEVRMVTPTGLT